jgi:hypothetical protein
MPGHRDLVGAVGLDQLTHDLIYYIFPSDTKTNKLERNTEYSVTTKLDGKCHSERSGVKNLLHGKIETLHCNQSDKFGHVILNGTKWSEESPPAVPEILRY